MSALWWARSMERSSRRELSSSGRNRFRFGRCDRGGSFMGASRGGSGDDSQRLQSHQLPPPFVPHAIAQVGEALADPDRPDVAEQLAAAMARLEMVVRHAGAEMVDVVEADVAAEELEDAREPVEGAALESGIHVVPVVASLPVHPVELVLHVEQ